MSQAKFNIVGGTIEMSAGNDQRDAPTSNKITNSIVNLSKDRTSELEAAEYIRDMIKELSGIASSANLVFLNYLLDVAYEEARIQSESLEKIKTI
jgi:hypothetical protein